MSSLHVRHLLAYTDKPNSYREQMNAGRTSRGLPADADGTGSSDRLIRCKNGSTRGRPK